MGELSDVPEVYSQTSLSKSRIVKFYDGKSIFVTGATGFLGTALIEKLLFACNVKTIYILMRQTRRKSIEKRLVDLLDSPAFQRIKDRDPNQLKKIIPVRGDLVDNNIGISDGELRLIQEEVSVVFHVAANISLGFVDLHHAITNNTNSTVKLIEICKRMKKLVSFVYVSSAYSNSNKSVVEEKVYKTLVPLTLVNELLQNPKSEKLHSILLDGRPNMYSHSKALAEEVVANSCDEIPGIVVRPSIILSAVKEPFPGWISSWAGPTSIIEGSSHSLWMFWHCDASNIVDVVPVDYVANLLIAAAWDTHNRRVKGDKEIKVFNCCSSAQNPIDSGTMVLSTLKYLKDIFGGGFLYTNHFFKFIPNYYLFWILFTIHNIILTIVLYTMDAMFWLTGKKKRMINLQTKLARLAKTIEFFTQNQFLFLDGNMRRLYHSLDEIDQHLFDFNIKNLQWQNYLRDYAVGIRKYNMKLL